jgi:hypothetical protein
MELIIAYNKFSSSIKRTVSREKVENVVKDPQMPTPTISKTLEELFENVNAPKDIHKKGGYYVGE